MIPREFGTVWILILSQFRRKNSVRICPHGAARYSAGRLVVMGMGKWEDGAVRLRWDAYILIVHEHARMQECMPREGKKGSRHGQSVYGTLICGSTVHS